MSSQSSKVHHSAPDLLAALSTRRPNNDKDIAMNEHVGNAFESAESRIHRLADEHGVVVHRSQLDDLADAITRMSGDDVLLDDTQRLLIALSDRGLVTAQQRMDLNIRYMRETAHK